MRYGAETQLRPGQVFARAREYFGPSGPVGLDLTEQSPNRLSFVGGGGWVLISAHRAMDLTRIELEVWQFDAEAQAFLASLPAPGGLLRSLVDWWKRRHGTT